MSCMLNKYLFVNRQWTEETITGVQENIVSLIDTSAQLKIGFTQLKIAFNRMQAEIDGYEDVQVTIETFKDISTNHFEHVCDAFSEQKDALNEIRSKLMDSPARARTSSSKEVLTNPDTLLPNTPRSPLAENPAPSIDTRSIDFSSSIFLKKKLLENPTEQSVLEHLFQGDEYQEFKRNYHDLGYEDTSEINLFEMYNILIQVPDTLSSNLLLLRQDETKVERHVCTILVNLTNTLETDCMNAV